MHVGGKLPGAESVQPDDAARADAAKTDAQKRSVARQFEGVLMQQLMKVMRETAKNGMMGSSEGASGQYMSMFDEVMAGALAEGGGIGLADKLYEAMGGKPDAKSKQPLPSDAGFASRAVRGGLPAQVSRPELTPPLAGLKGATSRLAQAAYALSAPEGGKQWGRAGTLGTRDLASSITRVDADGDVTGFSTGFRDSYKCNLFAFEAARRAGFEVPVVAREHGIGFPTSNTVTAEAEAGALRGGWANVVDAQKVGALKEMLARGEVGLMLTGSGSDGRAGHMALVERIHDVQVDARGEVQRIEFDGYEARADGAEHLLRRTWNRKGNGEDRKHARNGFDAIELLALRRSATPETPEITVAGAGPSTRNRDR
ncbi:MAG: rod-binding protein [Polyangiales bacterium]